MPPTDHAPAGDCFACQQEAAANVPPRERVVVTDHWRVAHAFDTSLPGWLVVLPRQHLLSLSELQPAAAAELGPLLAKLTEALEQLTGCVKTYLLLLAEAEGFAHLHLHLVPRMPDAPDEELGVRVFSRLGLPVDQCFPAAERDRLALAIREALA